MGGVTAQVCLGMRKAEGRGAQRGRGDRSGVSRDGVKPRRSVRAGCNRGDGPGCNTDEAILGFRSVFWSFLTVVRAQSAGLPFAWGRSKGHAFRASSVFEVDMIRGSVLRTAL